MLNGPPLERQMTEKTTKKLPWYVIFIHFVLNTHIVEQGIVVGTLHLGRGLHWERPKRNIENKKNRKIQNTNKGFYI